MTPLSLSHTSRRAWVAARGQRRENSGRHKVWDHCEGRTPPASGHWMMSQMPPLVSYIITWFLGLILQRAFKSLSKCQAHNGIVHLRNAGIGCGLPHTNYSILLMKKEKKTSGHMACLRLQSCPIAQQRQAWSQDGAQNLRRYRQTQQSRWKTLQENII